MLIGYARVSTDEQKPDLQRDANGVGYEGMFEDMASGAKAASTVLAAASAAAPKETRTIPSPA